MTRWDKLLADKMPHQMAPPVLLNPFGEAVAVPPVVVHEPEQATLNLVDLEEIIARF